MQLQGQLSQANQSARRIQHFEFEKLLNQLGGKTEATSALPSSFVRKLSVGGNKALSKDNVQRMKDLIHTKTSIKLKDQQSRSSINPSGLPISEEPGGSPGSTKSNESILAQRKMILLNRQRQEKERKDR